MIKDFLQEYVRDRISRYDLFCSFLARADSLKGAVFAAVEAVGVKAAPVPVSRYATLVHVSVPIISVKRESTGVLSTALSLSWLKQNNENRKKKEMMNYVDLIRQS